MINDTRADPFTLPEWIALHRESSLVSQLIGSGATALGRASYGRGFGEYYTAFFGLSIGIERLAKLILIADFALENNGSLPEAKIVRRFGHNIKDLIEQARRIATKRKISPPYIAPDHPVCAAAIGCLDNFSDASRGRYANFESIGNVNFDPLNEPVNKWWTEVVELILDIHYRGQKKEQAVKKNAAAMDTMIGKFTLVRFTNENSIMMSDVTTASERSGQTVIAQKFGRFYTLSVARWLSYVFSDLSRKASYHTRIDCLFGHYEFFSTYTVPDKFLLSRKIWPLS